MVERRTPDSQRGFQSLVVEGIERARQHCESSLSSDVAAAVKRFAASKTKIDKPKKTLDEVKLKRLVNNFITALK